MAKQNRLGWWLGLALLAGCGSTPPQEPATGMRLPSAPMPLSSPAPTPFPIKPPLAKSPAASAIPAVTALLAEAQTARDAGNLDNASALLERALRMQPKYALLWYRLAELRLRQEKPQMAVDLALKSKLLAGSDAELVRQNWALIAQAKHRLGDSAGELEAERQAAGRP